MGNMKFLFATVFLFASTCISIPTAAKAEERSITWALNVAPPFHVLDGLQAGKGMCDVLMQTVEHFLPEVSFFSQVMPQTRVGLHFEQSRNVCFPCMIKTPDHRPDVIQSEPTHVYPPHGVITSERMAARIIRRHGNPVSLDGLLEDKQFRLGFPTGRRFGEIHHLIEKHYEERELILISGENATLATLDLVQAGGLAYTIDYSSLITYYSEHVGGDLVFLPIEENQGDYVLGAIGCTNNEWGKQAIDTINRSLPEVRNHAPFMDNLQLWFRHADYDALMNHYIRGSASDNAKANREPEPD